MGLFSKNEDAKNSTADLAAQITERNQTWATQSATDKAQRQRVREQIQAENDEQRRQAREAKHRKTR